MGSTYSKTRHNVGMMCLDYLVEKNHQGSYKTKVNKQVLYKTGLLRQ